MIESLFTRENINGMRPHIQKTVDTLIADMVKSGCKTAVDLVENLALPTASYVSSPEIESRRNNTDMFGELVRPYMASSVFHSRTSSISLNMPLSVAMAAPQPLRHPQPTSGFHAPFKRTISFANVHRELLDYIGGLVDKRVVEPNGDLISKLVVEQVSTLPVPP